MLIEYNDISKQMQGTIGALRKVRTVFKRTLLGMSMKRRQKFQIPSRKLKKQILIQKKEINGLSILEFGSGEKHYIYLHGGAYKLKGQSNHYKFIRNFSLTKKARVTFIDYPVNCSYKDVVSKTQSVLDQLEFDAIIGDSAGGGLALSLKTDVPLFLFSPWLDLSMTNALIDDSNDFMFLKSELLECALIYADDLDLKDPMISPFYKEVSNKVTIYAGTDDILYHDIAEFEQKHPEIILHAYKGLPHVFPILVGTEESMDVIQDISL